MGEDVEIDLRKLSDYERSFVEKTGYWDEVTVSKREYGRDVAKEEKADLGITEYKIKVRSDHCFVPVLGCVLEGYMDISKIFGNRELINDFFSFLFEYAIEDEVNGGSPFYFYAKSQTYNFDYAYILTIIIKWAVEKLKVDELEFTRFLRQFSPTKEVKYLNPNYFLISTIFGDAYSFLSPISNKHFRKTRVDNKIIYYYNPTLVEGGNGKEYYFYSIPFSASMILFTCVEDTVFYLLEERDNLKLKQIGFGKSVMENKTAETFYKIDFPKFR